MTLSGRGSLGDHGFTRAQLRQGGGRGNGSDHFDELIGATELFVYQTPNKKPKGFESLKLYLEASECELIFTVDVPPELRNYETFRITHNPGSPSPTRCCAAATPGPTAATSFTASSSPCTEGGRAVGFSPIRKRTTDPGS